MALQQTVNIPIGVNLNFKYPDFDICTKEQEETQQNCYIKIDNLNGNKENLYLEVRIYDKKGGNLIFTKNYNFVPSIVDNSKNFIKQGYEYLKTLDEFKDAIDLLDEGQTA
jgi:hypothetical protein